MGIEFSAEQACEAVRKFPQLLGYSVDKYKAGWSMLTEGGLCLSPEEARQCFLRDPQVLSHDNNAVVLRVALLTSLGYADARAMVLRNPGVLCYKDETVKEHAAWWWQHVGKNGGADSTLTTRHRVDSTRPSVESTRRGVSS